MSKVDMGSVMCDIISRSLSKMSDDDIIRDGIRYCAKCGQPKTAKIKFFFADEPIEVGINCDCDNEVKAAYQREQEAKAREKRREYALPCAKYRDMTLDKSDRELTVARNYIGKWDKMYANNVGLLLYGSVGTGKTYMAAAIANALVDRGVSVYMDNCAEMVTSMRDDRGGGHNDVIYRASKCKLFVIDDFGAESSSDYSMQLVYELIEARTESGMPMIVTTNLSPANMRSSDLRMQRLYSRLTSLHPVLVDGEDQRKTETVNRYHDVNKELGLE